MKQLKNIKGTEAMKAFIKAGGISRRGKGDHVNKKMQKGQIITIPGSKVLKIGLVKEAIKKAGLTDEKFLTLL
ncbi:MAG: type II toxin-antitoxin system HicA family toxin [Candidatus Methanoperedens sp.]|nr:type II toxin-antitoxin system HicA family toxin [Candidatus Methanoperedens sp.]